MLRIAHISDLHIRNQTMNNDDRSLLQELAVFLLKKWGVEVEAGGHDPAKLDALKNRLVGLKPDVIVVTGDLTNFGDTSSLATAVNYLQTLRRVTGARKVLCIPGNHDCLVERLAAAKQELSLGARALLKLTQLLNREVDVMGEGAKRQFSATEWSPERVAKLLQNYRDFVTESEFGVCDPAQPFEIDAGWGKVAFFLFNSVNEPGLMANKGRIGIEQFNRLNSLAQDHQSWAPLERAVRVALLHHHPVSAPRATDGDINRLYDWMDDGPRFLWALNMRQFHFVLHGHQHKPFTCAISYGQANDPPTFVAAAGSATQGSMEHLENSFNVIDLVSPFEAVFARYDMDVTGFGDKPADTRLVPLRQLDRVRVSLPGEDDTVADWAIRKLVRSSGQEYMDLGEAYRYDELEFNVAITGTQLYCGRYRRKGELLADSGATGPVFVITGSPQMKLADMHLKGIDNLTQQDLSYMVISDTPHRKIICVQPRTAVAVGQTIDVTLSFEWQASATEPNDFDAINLMGFRHRVDRMKYRIRTPWRPQQVQLHSIGLSTTRLFPPVTNGPVQIESGYWEYSFEIDKPAALAYLIQFPA